jgi:hypothetical protein
MMLMIEPLRCHAIIDIDDIIDIDAIIAIAATLLIITPLLFSLIIRLAFHYY